MAEIIRIHEGQDLVKQSVLLNIYGIGRDRLYRLEEKGLPRYQLDSKAVFYSLKEFEEKIKEEARI